MTLSTDEFLRRFEMHFLPRRFVRIRHYGLLQNHGKVERLAALRKSEGWPESPEKVIVPMAIRILEKYGRDLTKCSKCNQGRYELFLTKRFEKVVYSKPRDVPIVG